MEIEKGMMIEKTGNVRAVQREHRGIKGETETEG